jgi:AraC family transcriptional regulator
MRLVNQVRAASRTLFRSPLLRIGEFRCPPGAEAWSRVNWIGGEAHVVFPRTSVRIQQLGREPVLSSRNLVLTYAPGQLYRRELHAASGDDCVFVALAPAALDDLGGPQALAFVHAPLPPGEFLVQHDLVRRVEAGTADALDVEETLASLLLRVVRRGVARPQRTRRAATRVVHRRLAEDAKALLHERYREPLALAELGRALHVSPFHLARVFREHTGFSVHGYRQQLRLRAAVEQLATDRVELAQLACDLGFASHSHLTDAFRRAFGLPPSALREPRTIVEAAQPAPA